MTYALLALATLINSATIIVVVRRYNASCFPVAGEGVTSADTRGVTSAIRARRQ